MIESKLVESEIVENKKRTFGSQQEYYPCYILTEDGKQQPALFTASQVAVAVERAERNVEDLSPNPDVESNGESGSFFSWLFS